MKKFFNLVAPEHTLVLYFSFFGAWGVRIMSHLPTWWYNSEQFWIDYPHWQMTPELKRYYLMQASYWCQQLVVLLSKLEKPRKDYKELVAHHIVTLWLVGWSYGINLTLIGNAVYTSMDIPDVLLAVSKIFNYLRWKRSLDVLLLYSSGSGRISVTTSTSSFSGLCIKISI